ncbi:HD family phosphohydrolase [Arcobacter lacus]|uniref:HD family phosphohydrolase n=1 Tax=Arcobacter lacus TaxID=1912876 RepID=A0ABX5JLG1_9BACT|nr:HD family phosphohydrolase [Arcobacter lacus]
MSIKRILKISFAMMLFIVFIIGFINTIIIYQIRENDSTKELIANLVSMQENMNELLKDVTNINSLKELELKKEKFLKYELEFEAIEKNFEAKDENDFVDIFISDIHKNELISTKLNFLYENEKEIEDAFYIIYDLENKKLDLKENIENQIIKELDIKIEELKNKIYNVINQNKVYSSDIEKKIAQLSADFINYTYFSILFLLLIIGSFIIILGYKVYKNIGLSVDEIETKVQEGLEEIRNLNHEIENTQKEVVFTMGAIGESRSKETGNHVKRVAEYSKLLALYYGLNEKEAEMLKQASPMHDIGKVAIPDAILNKPGRFDEDEREIMNTHAALGYEMLKHSNRPLLKMAAIVANEHHEKWDGSGYPKGLKGENIHIYGRITALADVFDALGSHRVYKQAWDDGKIFNLFKEERGKHFDPKLVDIFFEHLDEFLKIRETFKDKF